MKKEAKTNVISKAKTAEEILNELGLEPNATYLKIAQAAIDDGATIRQQIKSRGQEIMGHLQGFVNTIKKLGVQDIGDLIKQFARNKSELKKQKERTATAEQALLYAYKLLPAQERALVNKTQRLALRRANDAFPLAKYAEPERVGGDYSI